MKRGFLGPLAVCAVCTSLGLAQQVTPGAWEATLSTFAADRAPAPVQPATLEENEPEPLHKGTPVSQYTEAEDICKISVGTDPSSMEYLLWWIKDARLPPLLTTNIAGRAPILGQPGTRVLVGGSPLDNEERSGGRFMLGCFLESTQTIGLEGTYFFLGTRTTSLGASAIGLPPTTTLGQPFVDAFTGLEQAFTVTGATVAASARMQGAELNGVSKLLSGDSFQLEALAGFRYLEVDEGINITASYVPSSTTPSVSVDQFDGHNRFYGGQIGLRGDVCRGPVYAELLGKVALGDTYEVVRINGASIVGSSLLNQGTLATATNSGRFTRDAFAVVPEAQIRVGYRFGDQSRVFVGYSFLYLSDLTRPGDQIDRALTVTEPGTASANPLPGYPNRPLVPMSHTSFWAQGITLGMEYRY
jgi:hypothetical protein